MAIEIERKFLVKSNQFKKFATKKLTIKQGFLSTVPERTVRVRTSNRKAFLTVKGKSNTSGTSRFEWEKEILYTEAEKLLTICEPTVIKKIRYIIPVENDLFFEVDEFLEANEGLIIAEIELKSETQKFKKPSWLGKEVTGNIKYYNSVLSKHPYKKEKY